MTETLRLFVAAPIGERLRSELSRAVDEWRTRPDLLGLRWSDPAGWHLTLAFLGSTEAARVDAILRVIGAVASDHEPMQLRTGGVGAFPSAGRARVAWYGIGDPLGRLGRCAGAVGRALGLDTDRPYRPHLTLARARGRPVDLRPWLADASAPDGTVTVDRIELMRSRLGRGAARYESLGSVELEARVHA